MKNDLMIVKQSLELKHPQLYHYTKQEEFERLFYETEQSFTHPLSIKEFYSRVSPLIVALRCGHTKWIVPGKNQYYPFDEKDIFPLSLFFSDDKAYITKSYDSIEVPLNAELISINGEKVSDIRDRLFSHLSFADGYSLGGKYYELNNFFPGIYSTFIGTSPHYELVINDSGISKTLFLNGTSIDKIPGVNEQENQITGHPFKFEVLNKQTAWIDIDRFFTFKGEESYRKFLRKSFNTINEKQIMNLVIDLRGNEGGNENWGVELYRYLADSSFRYYDRISVNKKKKSDLHFKLPLRYRMAAIFNRKGDDSDLFVFGKGLKLQKPVANPFSGSVFLLLDGQSFSVTTEFASRAKSDKRCTIIGSETAGGYAMNSSGFFTIVNLPNSKIDLGIPLLSFQMADLSDNNPVDRGIIPDHYVGPSISLFNDGKDHVREYILNLIEESGVK